MVKRLFSTVLLFTLLIPFPVAGKVCDRVVGVVNGEVITLSDVDEAMPTYGKANILDEGNPLDKEIKLRHAREEVLGMLIEERLLQRVAQRFGIKVEDAEVEKAIEGMKKQGNINDEKMAKEVAAQGFTPEGYRHFLTEQIRKARIIEITIKPNISMAEEKIQEYYQSHLDNYLFPTVRVSQILIQVPPEATTKDWEQAKKKMEMVLQKLKGGASFEELASRYSGDSTSARSGGDLGFFNKGEMVPALEAVVFSLETGELSGVIPSAQGLHIFKVTEKRTGSVAPYEEIKEQVKEDYYREEVTKRYAKWLDDLKKSSNVEVKL